MGEIGMVILQRNYLVFCAICFLSNELNSQQVSNVKVEQSGNVLSISYSLNSSMPCAIYASVSVDDGATWSRISKGVIGDFGSNIDNGNHIIHWNVLDQFDQFVGDKVKFKIESSYLEKIKTISVGGQTWMSTNLNVERFRNGDLIPQARSADEWMLAHSNKQPAWCYYSNKSSNEEVLGKLYNYYAIKDSRGLAPIGWHLPSYDEWIILIASMGGEHLAGNRMKSKVGWFGKIQGSDAFGFSALPGGYRHSDGAFLFKDEEVYWWSSTKVDDDKVLSIGLNYEFNAILMPGFDLGSGLSVRCIRD